MLKIATIVGARPQFVKSAVISREIKKYPDITEIIIHTGQHYDKNMSGIFFKELDIPKPDYNLGVGSASHAVQTAEMLKKVEEVLIGESPEFVLVYGDTNSTLAGALAASKLHIKIAHIEAGLRSYNRAMPEEINRIVADHVSDLLFAPTRNALEILKKEGLGEKAHNTGDVMFDSFLFMKEKAEKEISIDRLISEKDYYLSTLHRQENTDNIQRLQQVFDAFSGLDLPVILPVHPRTRKYLDKIKNIRNTKFINPVSYKEMMVLLKNCRKVFTDSGGLQKEAYFMEKPCITLRDETEWIETLDNDWNILAGVSKEKIRNAVQKNPGEKREMPFGDGKAAKKIVRILVNAN